MLRIGHKHINQNKDTLVSNHDKVSFLVKSHTRVWKIRCKVSELHDYNLVATYEHDAMWCMLINLMLFIATIVEL